MFTVTPKQAADEIVACISVGRTPLLTSSPGMGKSSLMNQVARDYRLKLIDVRLSQCTPEDLNGFPMRNGNKATFTPFDIFPLEGDELPDGYDGWLLFLDELTSATKPVQAAAYKLILDRMVGSFHQHKHVAIVGAGNKTTDKAVVNQMSTALQSRLLHYELALNAREWVELAHRIGIDYRITSFIEYMPSKLMDFRPDHQDTTFPCPRTWEFLSDLIKGQEITESRGARVAGAIGEGCAVEFITFAKEFTRLPKFHQIIADPKGTPVTDEASTKYASMSMLIENVDEKTLSAVLEYVERFDIEFQIIFARGVVVRHPKLRTDHDGFRNYLRNMVRYLQ
jgi:hypothetical protein